MKEDEKCPSEEDKMRDILSRIGVAEGILDFHRSLIRSHEWLRYDEDRKDFIDEVRNEINEILKKDV